MADVRIQLSLIITIAADVNQVVSLAQQLNTMVTAADKNVSSPLTADDTLRSLSEQLNKIALTVPA